MAFPGDIQVNMMDTNGSKWSAIQEAMENGMSNDVSWNLASIMLIRSLDYSTFTYRWGGVEWSGVEWRW